ncbi:MAG: flagellar biosynthesis protein [Alcanivorax sp.]|jgi:flagellar biosynthesis protein
MSDLSKQRAVALQYLGAGAPMLVAKGEGYTAARIEELARQHDVPLVQDAMLTNLLGSVSLGDEIPENLYVAVAEVLALIYRMGDSVDSYE